MKEFDIFISYSRKDFSEVEALKQSIEQHISNVKCWFDLDGIESGEEFTDKIISSIENPPLSPLLYEGGEGFFDAFCRCLKAEGIDADSLTFVYGSAPRHSTLRKLPSRCLAWMPTGSSS